MFDVVRVAHSKRGDGEQQRRCQPARAAVQARAELVKRRHCQHAEKGRQRSAGEHDTGRVDEKRALECSDGPVPACQTAHDEEHSFPGEEHVEVQGRIKKIVRVEIALCEGKGAIEDPWLIGMMEIGESPAEAPDPEREAQDTDRAKRPLRGHAKPVLS